MKSKVNPQKHSRNGSKFALKPCLKTFALSFCYQDFTTGKRFPTMKSVFKKRCSKKGINLASSTDGHMPHNYSSFSYYSSNPFILAFILVKHGFHFLQGPAFCLR